MASLMDCTDQEWLQAESCLRSAQRLPAGPNRVEALRIAGKKRWLASGRLLQVQRGEDQGEDAKSGNAL